jgi:2-polyprenyl-3-methyl-5-hydroxy-6-metoxy-1,4-benzoquinol methylase
MTTDEVAEGERATLADYRRARPGLGLRASIRNRIFPFRSLLPFIPESGNVLDIGCGDGFMVNLFARLRPQVSWHGIDRSSEKTKIAEMLCVNPNVAFSSAVDDWQIFDAVTLIDVLHHVSSAQQETLLAQFLRRIRPGGVVVIKEIDRFPAWKRIANAVHDYIVSGERVHPRTLEEWRTFVERNGMRVTHAEACPRYVYPHIVLVAQKTTPPAGS